MKDYNIVWQEPRRSWILKKRNEKKILSPGVPFLKIAFFTLVELLVVIGVIAILASLLLPALNRARGKAYEIACVNNFKQIGFYWQAYAEAYNEWIVPSSNEPFQTSSATFYMKFNQALLSEYNNVLGSTLKWNPTKKGASKSFECPSEKWPVDYEHKSASTYYAYSHYGPNYWLSGIIQKDTGPEYCHRLTQIIRPTSAMTYGELYTYNYYFISQASMVSPKHGGLTQEHAQPSTAGNGKINFLFADQHVEGMTYRKFNLRKDEINDGVQNKSPNWWVQFYVGFRLL